MQRPLLHLACRHHVHELLLRAVFEVYWPATSGPKVLMFERFQKGWDTIDQKQYKTGLTDPYIVQILGDKKDQILDFIRVQLEVTSN